MFEVLPTEVEVGKIHQIAARARQRPVALRYAHEHVSPLLRALVEELRAAGRPVRFVRVPAAPDRVERVLLELAAASGPLALGAVAGQLRAEPEQLTGTLAALSELLADTQLVVDGWSALRVVDDTYDAGHAQDARLAEVRHWLAARARVIADREHASHAPIDGFERAQLEVPAGPPALLRNGAAQPRPDLWDRFAPDVGAYHAALAYLALIEDPREQDVPSSQEVRDRVARRLPASARELLFLLGAHRRALGADALAALQIDPEAGALLARLGLASDEGAGLALEPAWHGWTERELGDAAPALHRRLVQAFH